MELAEQLADAEATLRGLMAKWEGATLEPLRTTPTVLRKVRAALLRTEEELEARVTERTADLAETIKALEAEIAARRRTEEITVRLASFPELNPNPAFEADLNYRVHYANPAAIRLSPEIMTKGPKHPWLVDLPSAFASLQRADRTPLSREVKLGDAWYHETLFAAPDSQRIRAYAFDITERKRVEETLKRYQLLAERARDLVLFVRRDGRILEANEAAIAAYGYSRVELLALTIRDLRAPETRALTSGQMAQAETEGILFETIHCRKDSSRFPVEVSSCGTTLGGERVLLSLVRDITGRKQAEESLRNARDTLERQLAGRMAELTGASQLLQIELTRHEQTEEEIRRLGQALERRASELAALDKAGRALTTSLDGADRRPSGTRARDVLGSSAGDAGRSGVAAHPGVAL